MKVLRNPTESTLERLVEKYESRIPRYTSYPTAVELAPVDHIERVLKALGESHTEELSLYVHLPFCRSLCWFCACNKVVTQNSAVTAPYIEDLARELALITHKRGSSLTPASIHLGGGSPSFLSARDLDRLFDILDKQCSRFNSAGKSIELDPRTTDSGQIKTLNAAGFTRASLGVQDFDSTVQRLVHRIQPFELVKEVNDNLRENGFTSVNFDLIYGLPGQTVGSISETINRVITLRPDRIALYGYAHVEWKAHVQKALEKYSLPTPMERITLFCHAERLLTEAGYIPIGLDHFALPTDSLASDTRKRNVRRSFMGYTSSPSRQTLGIGVSSISDIAGVLYQNYTNLEAYSEAVRNGRLPVGKYKEKTSDDLIRGYLIERVMCQNGIRFSEIPSAIRKNAEEIIARSLGQLETLAIDGIVVKNADEISATPTGRYFLRSFAAVFDAYLPTKGQSAFSSSV